MDAIVVDGLEKTYGRDVRALDGIRSSVPEGEVFGLLGPNGAGKSTTVRILATLTRADAGRATVSGHDVASEAGAVRRAIGYMDTRATQVFAEQMQRGWPKVAGVNARRLLAFFHADAARTL